LLVAWITIVFGAHMGSGPVQLLYAAAVVLLARRIITGAAKFLSCTRNSERGTRNGRSPLCSAFRLPRSALTYSVALNRNRFGLPDGFPVIAPVVALLMIQLDTVADG